GRRASSSHTVRRARGRSRRRSCRPKVPSPDDRMVPLRPLLTPDASLGTIDLPVLRQTIRTRRPPPPAGVAANGEHAADCAPPRYLLSSPTIRQDRKGSLA